MKYLTKTGKSKITAKVIADSRSTSGSRMITFELEYPRVIHSELKTHRALSGNSMSSRAVPVKTLIKQVMEDPAMLVEFGKNKAGMQSDGEHTALIGAGYTPEEWWRLSALSAAKFAQGFDEAGYHKQVANRLIEPFQRMKTVISGTEWNNFFWLRVDPEADPTIRELARIMLEAYEESIPEVLQPGQWHTPYVDHVYDAETNEFVGYMTEGINGEVEMLTLEEAKAISASCCAQVSYRLLNSTRDKALDIYGKLLTGRKVHASPFEHQATPKKAWKEILTSDYDVIGYVNNPNIAESWEEGITHADRPGNLWSGNLKGFVQHRQLLQNNVFLG